MEFEDVIEDATEQQFEHSLDDYKREVQFAKTLLHDDDQQEETVHHNRGGHQEDNL